jgi:hypothetical protein
MKYIVRTLFCVMQFYAIAAQAQLSVTVSPPKVVGQKAVVQLAMKNNLAAKVESARAAVFLLDDQGTMVGFGTRWVIGGTKIGPALEPGKEATYNFVVQGQKPFATTNLSAKVSFTRVVLNGGLQIDPDKNVTINITKKRLK